MCDPVSGMIIASTAVAAIGKGVEAANKAHQYKYEARVATRNAALENEAARDAIDRGRVEAQRQYRKIGQVKGAQNAAMAANGVDLAFGSALDVQRDTAMLGAEDIGQIYKGSAQEVRGFEINASNYRAQARGARMRKKGAIVEGVFDVASTALDGATQLAKHPNR